MRLENVFFFFFFPGQQNTTLETSPKIIEPLSLSEGVNHRAANCSEQVCAHEWPLNAGNNAFREPVNRSSYYEPRR